MWDDPSGVALALLMGAAYPEGSKCCIIRILTCENSRGTADRDSTVMINYCEKGDI